MKKLYRSSSWAEIIGASLTLFVNFICKASMKAVFYAVVIILTISLVSRYADINVTVAQKDTKQCLQLQ